MLDSNRDFDFPQLDIPTEDTAVLEELEGFFDAADDPRIREAIDEFESHKNLSEIIADKLSLFVGSMEFVYVHALWFSLWIPWNLGVWGLVPFDPYPFGLLTMVVSLEAIFLATFLLISQNRKESKDRLRAEHSYAVSFENQTEISKLHDKLDKVLDLIKGSNAEP